MGVLFFGFLIVATNLDRDDVPAEVVADRLLIGVVIAGIGVLLLVAAVVASSVRLGMAAARTDEARATGNR